MLYGTVSFEFIAETDFKSASTVKKWFMLNHTFETKENGADYPVYEVNFTPKKENKHYRVRVTLHILENDFPAKSVNNDIKDFIHSINIDNYRHKTRIQVRLVEGSIDFSNTSSKPSSSPLSMALVGKRCPKGYTKNRKTGRCNKTKKNKASPAKKKEAVIYIGNERIVL